MCFRGKRMVEISWGKALGYGVRYIAYIIVWAIIGGLIVAGGAITDRGVCEHQV